MPERPYAPVIGGVFAGLGVLAISKYWHFILISNSDPMIVALCLAAIDCQLSRRHRVAFGFLVLAALGRPEVWPFVLLYAVWAWVSVAPMRAWLIAGAIVIPALWFGIPALTAKNWLVAGSLAENSVNALHGNKITGVISRLLHLYELPMQIAILAGLALAVIRRDRTVLLLAGAALLWVVIEIAFAFHGWSAVPRYLFEPAAVLIVIAGTAVGQLIAAGAGSPGLVRWAGPALIVVLVVSLLPVARSRARFVHGEVSYGRKFARQINRLHDVIASDGGRAGVLRCGQPVSALEFQSALAWQIGLNVGAVGWQVPKEIDSGRPIVLFTPRGWGWVVRPIHTARSDRASCSRLKTSTAFSQIPVSLRRPGAA